ncbi:hypothetical protein [Candidatus Foliamicus sp.]
MHDAVSTLPDDGYGVVDAASLAAPVTKRLRHLLGQSQIRIEL